MEVVDGQHRLLAAKQSQSGIYYVVIDGYGLKEVHALNLNQKNWNKKDFIIGYANMGYTPYVKLLKFIELNDDFNITDCVSMCQNSQGGIRSAAQKFERRSGKTSNPSEVLEEGTWIGNDFDLAQEWADKIRLLKPFYFNYKRSSFVGTIIGMLKNEVFDFNEFTHKLRLQPTALVDCANRGQYKSLIEDIYNYKRRDKVNLRY